MKLTLSFFALSTGLVAGRISSLHERPGWVEDKKDKTSYCDVPIPKAQGN